MLSLPLDRRIKGIKYFLVKYIGHYLEVIACIQLIVIRILLSIQSKTRQR
jgi:hypothetical protein